VLPVSIAAISYPPADQSLAAYRSASRTMLAQRYGWDSAPLILCVGRLIGLKAPELLIEALPQIHAQVGPVRVCIVGPSRADTQRGDYLTFLQQRASELGVDQFCSFPGYVPLAEIRDYLAAADLLAVPSRLEGLNRVVIEAGAVGTPTVISDGAGAAELVARYGCGLVTPSGSAPALAHAITRLLATPGTLARLAQPAQELARDHSAAAIAGGLAQIYQHALES
jgi:glycosyltransferase involved in cell wall biosynthesis